MPRKADWKKHITPERPIPEDDEKSEEFLRFEEWLAVIAKVPKEKVEEKKKSSKKDKKEKGSD